LTRKKNDQKTFKLLENIGSAHETELELEMIELPQQKMSVPNQHRVFAVFSRISRRARHFHEHKKFIYVFKRAIRAESQKQLKTNQIERESTCSKTSQFEKRSTKKIVRLN
jgi:hypothetical protein